MTKSERWIVFKAVAEAGLQLFLMTMLLTLMAVYLIASHYGMGIEDHIIGSAGRLEVLVVIGIIMFALKEEE